MDDRTTRLPKSDEYDQREELDGTLQPPATERNPVLEYAADEPRGPLLPARRTPNWWPLLVLLVMLILGVIVVALIASGGGDAANKPPTATAAPDTSTGLDADRPLDLRALAANLTPHPQPLLPSPT